MTAQVTAVIASVTRFYARQLVRQRAEELAAVLNTRCKSPAICTAKGSRGLGVYR